MGNRQRGVEPGARGVDLLGSVEKDGHRRLAVSSQQQHHRSGKLLCGEPETLDQRASPECTHAARLLDRARPGPRATEPPPKFLHREEADVAETRIGASSAFPIPRTLAIRHAVAPNPVVQ